MCYALLAGSALFNVHLEHQWQQNVELRIHLYSMHKGTSKLNNLYFTVMDECNHCELMYVMLSLALFLCCALFVHIYVCDTSSSIQFVHTPNNMILLCNSGDPQGCTPKVRSYLCLWEAMYNMFASGGQFTIYVLSICRPKL